jgi:hypothetical protein
VAKTVDNVEAAAVSGFCFFWWYYSVSVGVFGETGLAMTAVSSILRKWKKG